MLLEIKQKLRMNIRLVGSFRIFLFSRWRTLLTEHIFSLIAGRLRIRSLTLHCFYSMPYCTKSIGWRYYCCGDLVENKRQIWFIEA